MSTQIRGLFFYQVSYFFQSPPLPINTTPNLLICMVALAAPQVQPLSYSLSLLRIYSFHHLLHDLADIYLFISF